ncbi:RNA-metabolising metallo-beta-lactamase [Kalmanozyma brasiliensis GHG001]|uniref:Endoribonuclease YSH1 n=1 Tax=Kalmanozyma brasiliensis (strain GHG001) TaxID=1365824 RepID=V5GNA7_KALBG|nr:RNA-metabolising metallo-beta-lactamase [Kalmanozyma brasiliensis GHG001]EST07447.1 RNA-metabolising metallo-beta-lactamase [Kalmanozyma brasiliensis GHG001]
MAPAVVPQSSAGGAALQASAADDQLTIEMLGAGQEVGRSCCVLNYKGKTIVCDTGVHPAFTGIAALPFIDELDWSTVDAILITHFHLDHAAALTYIMEKTNFKDGHGKVYMTHPTKAVYRFLMSDFVRISNAGNDDNLFDENEMLASWRQIEAVDFHQDVSIAGGLRFTAYHAGHVLGACMFLIEIAGLRILYTGDFSREEDRHLVQAEIPPVKPDVLICESTYGTQTHEPRLDKEHRFTSQIHHVIKRGGRVLLPVFVLGRAQELLLLLDEYWAAHPELHSVPIYYASALAKKCISVYQTYIHTMNDHIRTRFNRRDNPFVFKHISNLRSLEKFEDRGPCVMMASPGFMQSGVSRELLERWAPDKRNGLIVSGYSVEGTMARNILNEPDEIIGMNGQKIPRRISVDYISFSAHVDFAQNSRFIDEIKAQHIVLVHGEQNNMSKLRAALQARFTARGSDVKIHTPRNCEPLTLQFRAQRTAKAIGAIAAKPPAQGDVVDGLLISKDFAYTILDPKDLTDFTGLSTSTIIQRQRVALAVSWEMVRWHLQGMYGRLQEGVDAEEGLRTLRIMGAVDVRQSAKHELLVEWVSSIANDMVADSIVALLLGIDSAPSSVKMTMHSHKHHHHHGETKAEGSDEDAEDEEALTPPEVGPLHPFSETALLAESETKAKAASDESIRHDAYQLAKIEHMAAFLEAHFGQVEELTIPEAPPSSEDIEETETKPSASAQTEDKASGAAEENADAGVSDVDMPTIKPDPDSTDVENATPEEPTASSPPIPIASLFDGAPRPALRVFLDEAEAVIDVENLVILASSPSFRARVEHLCTLALRSFTSLSDAFRLPQQMGTALFAGKHSQLASIPEFGDQRPSKMIRSE